MLIRRQTLSAVIHCSDTPSTMDIGAHEIRSWHVNENGWDDIGYHHIIRRSGLVELGRDIRAVGAHTRGFNSESVGVCLVGGKTNEISTFCKLYTEEQRDTLISVLNYYRALWPQIVVAGHRGLVGGRLCPSFQVEKFLQEISW